jgi:hypothetical protein
MLTTRSTDPLADVRAIAERYGFRPRRSGKRWVLVHRGRVVLRRREYGRFLSATAAALRYFERAISADPGS